MADRTKAPDRLARALHEVRTTWHSTPDPWAAAGAHLRDLHHTVARARQAGASWHEISVYASCTPDQMRAFLELTLDNAVAGSPAPQVRLLWPSRRPRSSPRGSPAPVTACASSRSPRRLLSPEAQDGPAR